MANKADAVYCRWCELMIKVYPLWDTWGRAHGETSNRFKCRMRPEAGPNGELGHEPPETDGVWTAKELDEIRTKAHQRAEDLRTFTD